MPDNAGRPPRRRRASSRGSDSVSKPCLRDEVVTFHLPGVGNTVAVLPVVPEDAPYKIREGIARRRITTITGKCPCGAVVDFHAALRDGVTVAEVAHERLCPADTDSLVKQVRRWLR